MTSQEQKAEFERKQAEFMHRFNQERAESTIAAQRAHRQAALVQQEINDRPQRRYAAIVAVDLRGGFSKDGKIPWHYNADFRWFQNKTKPNVCVMGRTTYDDINKRLGDKADESVLPARTCIVVTSSPLPRKNATAISSLTELDVTLDRMNIPYDKTVFFCGGERIYLEGLSKCNTVYMTVVNKDVGADRFFPLNALQKLDFTVKTVEGEENEPDLKFVTYAR